MRVVLLVCACIGFSYFLVFCFSGGLGESIADWKEVQAAHHAANAPFEK